MNISLLKCFLEFTLCRRVFPVYAALVLVSVLRGGDDWQLWISANGRVALSDSWAFHVNPEVRIRDDFSNPSYVQSRQGFLYQAEPWLRLGLNYLYAQTQHPTTKTYENRLEAEITFLAKYAGVSWSMRNRFDSRFFSNGDFQERYRMRVEGVLPLPWIHEKLSLFGSEEIFLNFEGRSFSRNRLTGGFSYNLGDGIALSTYYMRQYDRRDVGPWTAANVLGLGVNARF